MAFYNKAHRLYTAHSAVNVALTFNLALDEIIKFGYLNESYRAVLYGGAEKYAAQSGSFI